MQQCLVQLGEVKGGGVRPNVVPSYNTFRTGALVGWRAKILSSKTSLHLARFYGGQTFFFIFPPNSNTLEISFQHSLNLDSNLQLKKKLLIVYNQSM